MLLLISFYQGHRNCCKKPPPIRAAVCKVDGPCTRPCKERRALQIESLAGVVRAAGLPDQPSAVSLCEALLYIVISCLTCDSYKTHNLLAIGLDVHIVLTFVSTRWPSPTTGSTTCFQCPFVLAISRPISKISFKISAQGFDAWASGTAQVQKTNRNTSVSLAICILQDQL